MGVLSTWRVCVQAVLSSDARLGYWRGQQLAMHTYSAARHEIRSHSPINRVFFHTCKQALSLS